MSIAAANIKFYQCQSWLSGESHGGDIDTGSGSGEITSGVDQNIFDDVTNLERVDGDTDYRKIYVRNENADTWESVKLWVDTFTPAANDEISIKAGTDGGIVSGEGNTAGYVSPSSKAHGDVINIGDLAQNAYASVWIKRIVAAAGDGYTENNFKLAFESS